MNRVVKRSGILVTFQGFRGSCKSWTMHFMETFYVLVLLYVTICHVHLYMNVCIYIYIYACTYIHIYYIGVARQTVLLLSQLAHYLRHRGQFLTILCSRICQYVFYIQIPGARKSSLPLSPLDILVVLFYECLRGLALPSLVLRAFSILRKSWSSWD